MQTAATTSHAALTASPRLSATIANAAAPRRATAIHKSFVCGALELLMVIMNVLPHGRKAPTNKFHPREDLDQGKSVLPGKNHIGTMRRRMSNVARDFRFTPESGHEFPHGRECPLRAKSRHQNA